MTENEQLIKDLNGLLSTVNRKMNTIQRKIEKHEDSVPERNANRNDVIAWSKKSERMSKKLVRWINVYLWLSKKINEMEKDKK